MRNGDVLRGIEEQRNSLRAIKGKKANWIRHILCRNCLLKYVIERKMEGRIEVTGKRGRRISSYGTSLRKRRILRIEGGSTRSHRAEKSLWKKLWTCLEVDYVVTNDGYIQK